MHKDQVNDVCSNLPTGQNHPEAEAQKNAPVDAASSGVVNNQLQHLGAGMQPAVFLEPAENLYAVVNHRTGSSHILSRCIILEFT